MASYIRLNDLKDLETLSKKELVAELCEEIIDGQADHINTLAKACGVYHVVLPLLRNGLKRLIEEEREEGLESSILVERVLDRVRGIAWEANSRLDKKTIHKAMGPVELKSGQEIALACMLIDRWVALQFVENRQKGMRMAARRELLSLCREVLEEDLEVVKPDEAAAS